MGEAHVRHLEGELQRALGNETEWHDGQRDTSPASLRAATMVLSGVVNKRLVASSIILIR